MHSFRTRQLAIDLRASGWEYRQISRELGISTSTLQSWFRDPHSALAVSASSCWLCTPEVAIPSVEYLYLLGQYLGDGHLVTSTRVPVLRLAMCTDYPSIIEEAQLSIKKVRSRDAGVVTVSNSTRLINLQSYWMHWTCVLPQHGPGMKHQRTIELAPWQASAALAYPWPLIRGLVHSDGCRALNRIKHGDKVYTYPRYQFSNESTDIMRILTGALDLVGVRWTMCRPNLLAVSRRADVALMDEHIGPKS